MTRQQSGRDNTGDDQVPSSTTGVPRWVKIFLLVAVAIAVFGVVIMLLVGGGHGPGRHESAAAASHRVVATSAGWGLG